MKKTANLILIMLVLSLAAGAFAQGKGKGKSEDTTPVQPAQGKQLRSVKQQSDANEITDSVQRQNRERMRGRMQQQQQAQQRSRQAQGAGAIGEKAAKQTEAAQTAAEEKVTAKGKGHQQQMQAFQKKFERERAKHQRRIARIKRIRRLAQNEGDQKIIGRVNKLLEKENNRYKKRTQKSMEKAADVIVQSEKQADQKAQKAAEKVKAQVKTETEEKTDQED